MIVIPKVSFSSLCLYDSEIPVLVEGFLDDSREAESSSQGLGRTEQKEQRLPQQPRFMARLQEIIDAYSQSSIEARDDEAADINVENDENIDNASGSDDEEDEDESSEGMSHLHDMGAKIADNPAIGMLRYTVRSVHCFPHST